MLNFVVNLFASNKYKYRYIYVDTRYGVHRVSKKYYSPKEAEELFVDEYRPILQTKILADARA